MITIAVDGSPAATLPDHVGIPVSLPGLSQRDPSGGGGRITLGGCRLIDSQAPLFGFRMLASADLSKVILCGCARRTCRDFTGIANRYSDRRYSLLSLS